MRRYWAQVGSSGAVKQTAVSESDEFGSDWLSANIGGVWVEYAKDGSIRKNPAGIGYTYDEDRDAFIPPKPFESWVLDETTCLWVAPVDMPDDGQAYVWDESVGEWVVSE